MSTQHTNLIQNTIFKEYRRDGWPFCPRCEEDELYTLLNANEFTKPNGVTVQECIDAGVRCYRCNLEYLTEISKQNGFIPMQKNNYKSWGR